MGKYIGCDLGGTNIKGAIVDSEKGIVYGVRSIPTLAHEGHKAVIDRIAAYQRERVDRGISVPNDAFADLDDPDGQRVRLLRHLLGDDNESGIGKRGEDDQKHAHPAAGGLHLRQGKKPDADHGESSAEHGLFPRTGPGHDRREDGDQNDRHVFDQGTDAAVDATEPEHFKDHDGGAQDAEDQAAA